MPVIQYLLSVIAGLGILVSLVGWGGGIKRLFFPQHDLGWGQQAAWGIALSTCIGGLLNWTWMISRWTLLVWLVTGALLWLQSVSSRRRLILAAVHAQAAASRRDKFAIIALLLIISLSLVQYAGTVSVGQRPGAVSSTNFNAHDDFQSYFISPLKMLQAGSIGPDPFNERRMESSLGGQAFLHALVLSVLSERNLFILDPGIAILVVLGLILGCRKQIGMSSRAAFVIPLVFLLIPIPTMNTSSVVVGSALFLSLFCTLEWIPRSENHFLSRAFIIALLSSAICSLKSTFIPACAVTFTASYVFFIAGSTKKREALAELAAAVIFVAAFLLPWMLSMDQSSGTLLFPVLGRGYHGSVYGTAALPGSEITLRGVLNTFLQMAKERIFVAFGLLALFSLLRRKRMISGREAAFSVLTGSCAGILTVVFGLGGVGYDRYPFPFLLASIIAVMITMLGRTGSREFSEAMRVSSAFAAVLAGGILIGSSLPDTMHNYRRLLGNIQSELGSGGLVSAEETAQYLRVQDAVPEGERFLARLEKPFLLNFRRNQVFVLDVPGGASPPPGMPVAKGTSEALAAYLVSQSIRYVAYSYGKEGGFQRDLYSRRLRGTNPWIRRATESTLDFQDNLVELGRTKRHVYDDGEVFVLDLQSP